MPNAIQNRLNQLQNPGFGAFSRLATSGIPSLSDLIASQRATGGRRLFAEEQNQANQQRARSGAFDAYTNYRLSNDSSINQLLGLQQRGEQFDEDLFFRRQQFRDMQGARRADRAYGLLNQFLGIGGAIGGAVIGGAPGALFGRQVGYGVGNMFGGGG